MPVPFSYFHLLNILISFTVLATGRNKASHRVDVAIFLAARWRKRQSQRRCVILGGVSENGGLVGGLFKGSPSNPHHVEKHPCQHQWYHSGIGAPPVLVFFSGDWDVL